MNKFSFRGKKITALFLSFHFTWKLYHRQQSEHAPLSTTGLSNWNFWQQVMFSSSTIRTNGFAQGMNLNQPWKSVPANYSCTYYAFCALCSRHPAVLGRPVSISICSISASFSYLLVHYDRKSKLWQSFLQSIEEMPALDKKNFSFFLLLPEYESLISIKLPQTDLHWMCCIYKPIYELPTQYKYLEKEQVSESLSRFNSATVFKMLCWFWKEGKTMLSPMF